MAYAKLLLTLSGAFGNNVGTAYDLQYLITVYHVIQVCAAYLARTDKPDFDRFYFHALFLSKVIFI
jgi:hypothetical protein